ncbi:hypothetical protein LA04_16585 [Enterobacter sp. UCD-UG_FMILLET]|nr:hypothetical protein LA04_16585 [Enterobacter sp. UCD-UG_FMILLET]
MRPEDFALIDTREKFAANLFHKDSRLAGRDNGREALKSSIAWCSVLVQLHMPGVTFPLSDATSNRMAGELRRQVSRRILSELVKMQVRKGGGDRPAGTIVAASEHVSVVYAGFTSRGEQL